VKFAVIAAPRVGTHMLRAGLNEHPGIFVSDEVLNPNHAGDLLRTRTGKQIIEKWQREAVKRAPNLGTLLHRNLYWVKVRGAVWKDVGRMHTKFVSLVRDNILKKYLSQEVAMKLRNWNSYKPRTKTSPRIKLSVYGLQQHVLECRNYFDTVDMRYPNKLVVVYEDLCESWQATMARVQKYLGVPVRKLKVMTVRQEKRSLQDSILNYDEVAAAVTSWGCARWL